MSDTEPPVVSARASTVVIAGASSGIGRCTALLFARSGWRVGLIARGAVGLAAVHADITQAGGQAYVVVADVCDEAGLEDAAKEIERAMGAIDVWINCAGNGRIW